MIKAADWLIMVVDWLIKVVDWLIMVVELVGFGWLLLVLSRLLTASVAFSKVLSMSRSLRKPYFREREMLRTVEKTTIAMESLDTTNETKRNV